MPYDRGTVVPLDHCPLPLGTRLGPYEIAALLGEGGMGQVYRACDTRLDRSVAIKVLAPELAGAAAFRERFEREARSIAALSHPNICTLRDVGRHDGIDFLVMEFDPEVPDRAEAPAKVST